jgi:hypothetical protein
LPTCHRAAASATGLSRIILGGVVSLDPKTGAVDGVKTQASYSVGTR